MELINHDLFIGKELADAVEINRNAGIALAVLLEPVDVIVQRVKAAQQAALPGVHQVGGPGAGIHQLEFVDVECQIIGHIGGGRVTQAGVELDPLPLGRVVAGRADQQPGDFLCGR